MRFTSAPFRFIQFCSCNCILAWALNCIISFYRVLFTVLIIAWCREFCILSISVFILFLFTLWICYCIQFWVYFIIAFRFIHFCPHSALIIPYYDELGNCAISIYILQFLLSFCNSLQFWASQMRHFVLCSSTLVIACCHEICNYAISFYTVVLAFYLL